MSRYWMTFDTSFRASALSRIRTCINVTLIHAPLPVGLPEQHQQQWSRRDLNPHRLGANQASCQLEDGPVFFCPKRCGKDSNLHPRPSEGRALIRLSYHNVRVALYQWSRQDSNLQQRVSETRASTDLGY